MFAARLGARRFLHSVRPVPRRIPMSRLYIRSPQQTRFASYQRFPGRGGGNYSAGPFGRVQYIWHNYQRPVLVVGAAGGTVYVINLEEVPITHRRRFNCIGPELEKQLVGDAGYQEILKQYRGKIFPKDHQYTQMVARVVERLLPSTGGLAGEEWAVHVIDEPNEMNAFVMPGGKVFVFSGILPICQDENGLAAVLGHEIAHNIAHHTAERLSRSVIVLPMAFVVAFVLDVSGGLSNFLVDLLLSLPNSRAQETEADHIGLLIMAESCFDPNSAVAFWGRMQEAEKKRGGAPPQFMSTHPSSHNRADTIRKWLPEANQKLESSQCGSTTAYAKGFMKTLGGRGVTAGRPHDHIQRPSNNDDDFF